MKDERRKMKSTPFPNDLFRPWGGALLWHYGGMRDRLRSKFIRSPACLPGDQSLECEFSGAFPAPFSSSKMPSLRQGLYLQGALHARVLASCHAFLHTYLYPTRACLLLRFCAPIKSPSFWLPACLPACHRVFFCVLSGGKRHHHFRDS